MACIFLVFMPKISPLIEKVSYGTVLDRSGVKDFNFLSNIAFSGFYHYV